jgi:SAM-dependent methyltransferase
MSDEDTILVYAGRANLFAGLDMTQGNRDGLARFIARLPEGAKVLDLGCGPGTHAALMQQAGLHVTGHDPCEAFIRIARAKGVDAHLAEASDLDAEAAYDAIWASFSLLHTPRAEMPGHLAAIARALVPGGWLHLGLKLGEGEGRDDLGRFYAYYSEAELRDLLQDAGFEVIEIETGEERGLAGTIDPFIVMTARHG